MLEFLGGFGSCSFYTPPKEKEEKNIIYIYIYISVELQFVFHTRAIFGCFWVGKKYDNQVLKYPKNADVPHSERIDFVES